VPVDIVVDTSLPDVSTSPTAADTNEDAERENGVAAEDRITEAQLKIEPKARSWKLILAYALLCVLALTSALGAGYFKWQDARARESQAAAAQSVAAAADVTIALLSYRPDTVEKDLSAAHDRLTGPFRDAYSKLVHDVVIPGAKQKQISAVATVAGAASLTATGSRAVVLLFVDQTTTVGNNAPTNTTSTIRVTLDKAGDRWLVSQFEPI
jgi:Mce-associated membrane protein